MTAARRTDLPHRANLALSALYAALAIGLLAAGARVDALWLPAIAIAFGVVMNGVYSLIHEAEHGLLHPREGVNYAVGAALALLFPAPYSLIRQGHLGHHLRNRSDDEAFDLLLPGESRAFKYLQYYSILTGLWWLTVASSPLAVLVLPVLLRARWWRFNHASRAFFEVLNGKYDVRIRVEAVCAIALHAALIYALGAPWRYAAVYAGFAVSWSTLQYIHHVFTPRDQLRGARNVKTFAALDWFWLHHNLHLAHHLDPSVPWSKLPQVAVDAPVAALPVYARMWRGPQPAGDSVPNKYAGSVIR
jgi:fatty acid desaturase